MTNRKTTGALFSSVIALILCCAMLVGSTFAWFTDSASTSVNTIQSGNLKVDIVDANGTSLDGEALEFVAADNRANILWEPGCTYELEPFQIVNNGNLALKYEIVISGLNGDAELLKVIEWTATVGGVQCELNELKGFLLPNGTNGDKSGEIIISAHMAEEAGNEFQNKTLSGISVTVMATQHTYEQDSTDNQYDKDADMLPHAYITDADEYENVTLDWKGFGPVSAADPDQKLEAVYKFVAPHVVDSNAANSVDDCLFKDWICDYYVSIDRDILAGDIFLGGNYGSFGWVGFENPEPVAANTEVPLLGSVLAEFTYYEIVSYVSEFLCGVSAANGGQTNLNGATFTVKLRLTNPEDDSDFYDVSTVKYTFTEKVSTADELKDALSAGTSVSLTADVDLGTEQISVPTGAKVVLDLNGHDVVGTQEGTKTYGLFNVVGGAELTVVGDGNVTVKANVTSGISACIFQNDGTLNIYGGNYEANQEASVAGLGAVIAVIDNCPYNTEAVVNIYDGTFAVTGVGAINVIRNWPIHAEGVATLNVYGGLFKANPTVSTTYLWNKDDSTPATLNSFMNFYGGTFEAGVVYEDYNGQDDIYVAPGVTIQPYSGNN